MKFIALALIAFPGLAYSHDVKLTSAYDTCIKRAAAVDPKIMDCMSDEYERQDKRLNKAYKKILSDASAGQKKRLQEAQRLWVKYTEANCGFYYDPDGGTSARLSAYQCEVDARAARAAELEGFLGQ